MDGDQLQELHYIAPIENLRSILADGLLCHRRAEAVHHLSVALADVQALRAAKVVPGGGPVHDYVNLYINGRNPMMFTVARGRGVEGLCLVRVSPEVLDEDGVVITDVNAATSYVRFGDARDGLAMVDHDRVFARYWTHPEDGRDEQRHKAEMCAEVLVPDRVGPEHITGVHVGASATLTVLTEAFPDLDVTLEPYLFFAGG